MKSIPLSSIDHIFTGAGSYPIEFVFSYAESIDPARLQESLEETLEHFPPLRSKLVRISDDAYGFRYDPDGLSCETTSSSSTFDDTSDFYQFLNPVDTVEGKSLTRIKLTQTPTGSVLGVSISHAVVDGFSYFYFLSSWSRIFNGNSVVEPSHQRELLIPEISARQNRVTPDDVLARSGAFWCDKRGEISRDQISWERFLLSREKMNQLLKQAQKENESRLSHNDVIVAYLWKKVAGQWNNVKDNPITHVSCPFDLRRLLPGFPKTYFGCAVCLATTSMSHEELASSSLGNVASTIRAAIDNVSESYALGSLEAFETLRRQEGLEIMEAVHVMHPLTGLIVTNISHLPVTDFDFGAGAPTGYQILTPSQRAAVILPAEDGVEIRVCHPAS